MSLICLQLSQRQFLFWENTKPVRWMKASKSPRKKAKPGAGLPWWISSCWRDSCCCPQQALWLVVSNMTICCEFIKWWKRPNKLICFLMPMPPTCAMSIKEGQRSGYFPEWYHFFTWFWSISFLSLLWGGWVWGEECSFSTEQLW